MRDSSTVERLSRWGGEKVRDMESGCVCTFILLGVGRAWKRGDGQKLRFVLLTADRVVLYANARRPSRVNW